jgi:hypothetical protein
MKASPFCKDLFLAYLDQRLTEIQLRNQNSLLDREKIAKSSSSEVTTTPPTETVNMSTNIKDYVNMYRRYAYQYLSSDWCPKNKSKLEALSPVFVGAFGCCGAEMMQGCSGVFLTTRELREEFVHMLFQHKRTIYFLPTTQQMTTYRKNKNSVLNLLFECGAKEVHKNPNRLHGPNELHLCVLDRGDPEIIKMVYEKFLTKAKFKDLYSYDVTHPVPRFIAERCGLLNVEEKKDEVVKAAPRKIFQKGVPIRDKFGRFAKKVAV